MRFGIFFSARASCPGGPGSLGRGSGGAVGARGQGLLGFLGPGAGLSGPGSGFSGPGAPVVAVGAESLRGISYQIRFSTSDLLSWAAGIESLPERYAIP